MGVRCRRRETRIGIEEFFEFVQDLLLLLLKKILDDVRLLKEIRLFDRMTGIDRRSIVKEKIFQHANLFVAFHLTLIELIHLHLHLFQARFQFFDLLVLGARRRRVLILVHQTLKIVFTLHLFVSTALIIHLLVQDVDLFLGHFQFFAGALRGHVIDVEDRVILLAGSETTILRFELGDFLLQNKHFFVVSRFQFRDENMKLRQEIVEIRRRSREIEAWSCRGRSHERSI